MFDLEFAPESAAFVFMTDIEKRVRDSHGSCIPCRQIENILIAAFHDRRDIFQIERIACLSADKFRQELIDIDNGVRIASLAGAMLWKTVELTKQRSPDPRFTVFLLLLMIRLPSAASMILKSLCQCQGVLSSIKVRKSSV